MLKFIKHHMETITGIELFPLLSFVMFFLFFIVVTWYVFKMDKSHWLKISQLPIDVDPADTDNPEPLTH